MPAIDTTVDLDCLITAVTPDTSVTFTPKNGTGEIVWSHPAAGSGPLVVGTGAVIRIQVH